MNEDDRHRPPGGEEDLGGDPVCWAHLVCPECGRFAAEEESRTAAGQCPECGADLS
jgi:rubrerythrin